MEKIIQQRRMWHTPYLSLNDSRKIFAGIIPMSSEFKDPEIEQALRDYSAESAGCASMQAYLRGETLPCTNKFSLERTKKAVETLSSFLDSIPPTTEELIVFRGIKEPKLIETVKKLSFGSEIAFLSEGFVSTSFQFSTALNFAGYQRERCIFKLIIPKGSKALFLDNANWASEEFEVLLPHNSRFSVLSIETIDNQTNVTAILFSQGEIQTYNFPSRAERVYKWIKISPQKLKRLTKNSFNVKLPIFRRVQK